MIHKVEELFKRFFILESYNEHEHIKPDKTASSMSHWVEELLTNCLVPRTHVRLREGTSPQSSLLSPHVLCSLFLPALRWSSRSKRSSPQCPPTFLPFQLSNLLCILSFFNFCLCFERCSPREAVVLQTELFPLENQSSSFPV